MKSNSIQITSYSNNENITVNTQEAQQNNNKFYDKVITIIKDCSFVGFVVGGFVGALIGVPIAFAKGFASSYVDISTSSSLAIALTTYFLGCLLGAYYKPIFSTCKQIITKNYLNSDCSTSTLSNV